MVWLLLILLVPVVLIPVVFLAGFVGCGFQHGAISPSPPSAPSNLTATAVSTTQINLTWMETDVTVTSFRIARSESGGTPIDPTTSANPAPAPGAVPLQWSDHDGLTPGTEYEYQVFATASSTGLESAGSNTAQATTFPLPPLPTAYDTPLTTDDTGFEGSTIVNRIDAAHITSAATKVRITLRGSSVAALTLNKVTISGPDPAGQAWDSGPDLTQVLFGGNSAVTIPAGTAKVSDDTAYNLILGNDLMVAFDVSTSAGSVRFVQLVGPKMHFKKNVAEAGLQNRTANYNARTNSVYIVEKIEVVA